MTWWEEFKAGAPVFRGRWAAIFWLWMSGELIGDMDVGFVWVFVGDSVANSPGFQPHWGIDIVMFVGAMFCLFMGVQNLNRYGRNAWLTWAPKKKSWNGVFIDTVEREPAVRPLALWLSKHRWWGG